MNSGTSNWYRNWGKRLVDIGVSAVVLLAMLPFFVVVWLLVRIFLGSPAIFTHHRPGRGGKPFLLYKFRSMTTADRDHLGNKLEDDQRLGRFGRLLRSTSLDEIPELWNVLRGDMSLVGPRPLLMHYLELYSPEEHRRHDVRPGLTGWAQVNGRNAISFTERFELDVWYVDNLSLGLDLRILFLTAMQVFLRRGIEQKGGKNEVLRKFGERER
jgi:lipopolysaccharide/colanic/teichoic acid biosynthesis glycosyltransferase